MLVEKLATNLWRYRRLLVAEAAEIEMRAEFVEWDEQEREGTEARSTFRKLTDFDFDPENRSLMQKMENPVVLERCLNLLESLKSHIEARGFEPGVDLGILKELYGYHQRWAETPLDSYKAWESTAECSDEEREQEGYPSVGECKTHFLKSLQAEIKHLSRYSKERASIESERIRLESLRWNVPNAPQLDRLLRYEATLERAFNKGLIQLERLQRMRRGEAIAPPLNVNLSSS